MSELDKDNIAVAEALESAAQAVRSGQWRGVNYELERPDIEVPGFGPYVNYEPGKYIYLSARFECQQSQPKGGFMDATGRSLVIVGNGIFYEDTMQPLE